MAYPLASPAQRATMLGWVSEAEVGEGQRGRWGLQLGLGLTKEELRAMFRLWDTVGARSHACEFGH